MPSFRSNVRLNTTLYVHKPNDLMYRVQRGGDAELTEDTPDAELITVATKNTPSTMYQTSI